MITIKMIPVKMPPEYHLNFVQNGTRSGSFVFSVSASRFCARLSCSSRENISASMLSQLAEAMMCPSR